MTTQHTPELYAIHVAKKLWISDGSNAIWKLNPPTTQISHYVEHNKVENKKIWNYNIPALYATDGLFATQNIVSKDKIMNLDGVYYLYDEWREFGQQSEENNVIQFTHNGIDFIFEPLENSKWKLINDCKGHKEKINANCTFDWNDNNKHNIPLFSVIALSNIKPNDQLFVQYGDDYWKRLKYWNRHQENIKMFKKAYKMCKPMKQNIKIRKEMVVLFMYGIKKYNQLYPLGESTENEKITFISNLFNISEIEVFNHLSDFVNS